ncbi:MAG: UDP-4-amino-4,6-dideoxy-N-acetyl-beta-L-altrosamine N-acetyltransferase [Campylobacterales bacterium]|nr:UDP-4-amino-4,6-dideoxy-N-acetyl-beta-L-altrosamine N-acetyltransferase [Campylobacterales bacterium]
MIKYKNFTELTGSERDLVLKWRNSYSVRSQMAQSKVITPEEHYRFIDKLKTDTHTQYFLAILKEPIGVIYLENIEKTKAEIGIYVDPHNMGKGYGKRILKEFIITLDLTNIYLKVKESNVPAIKFYEKIGFKRTLHKGDFLEMILWI